MFLVYLDESGSPYVDYQSYCNKHEVALPAHANGRWPAYPFFVLAGVGIQECHLGVIDEWFHNMKESFLASAEPIAKQEYEIKGEVIYSLRTGVEPADWRRTRRGGEQVRARREAQEQVWRLLRPHQVEQLEQSIFDLLRRLAPTIWVVVVKQRHVFRRHRDRTWPPYYQALTYLQQRVVHHAQAQHGTYQRAMFVMDEAGTLKTAAHFDKYLEVRGRINRTASWPADFTRYVVDVPVYGQSHLHQALQLADVVAHAVMRHVRSDDTLGWFGQIEPLLARHFTTGSYRNAGLTFIQ